MRDRIHGRLARVARWVTLTKRRKKQTQPIVDPHDLEHHPVQPVRRRQVDLDAPRELGGVSPLR